MFNVVYLNLSINLYLCIVKIIILLNKTQSELKICKSMLYNYCKIHTIKFKAALHYNTACLLF